MGSALYRRAMAYYDANDREPETQHKCWDGLPWMPARPSLDWRKLERTDV